MNEKMDMAAELALSELDQKMKGSSGEELKGIEWTIKWIASHYMAAGYKRLGRGVVAVSKTIGAEILG